MRRPLALFACVISTWAVASLLLGARPAAPVLSSPAPEPHSFLLDTTADPIYRLPPGELSPEVVSLATDAPSDMADWGHAAIGVPEAWKTTKGKGATVAVLDTGCDTGHRDLKRVSVLKDFTNSRSGASDVSGHGTWCIGCVGAAENGVGMVGVAPECSLLSGKVLGDNGSGLSSWIAAGIDWAVANGADVISMSLGSNSPDARIDAAINRALAKGVIVVAAGGNSGPGEGTTGWPGATAGVVCVAATDTNNRVANFSSRGRAVQVAAPGVNTRSCFPGDRFATMSGSSMATPYVAGCAALYVSYCKSKGIAYVPNDFAKAIAATSRDLPPTGRDTASGFGLIQPAKLFPASTVPEPKPKPPEAEPDRVRIELPPELAGRKLKAIVLEFEPVKP